MVVGNVITQDMVFYAGDVYATVFDVDRRFVNLFLSFVGKYDNVVVFTNVNYDVALGDIRNVELTDKIVVEVKIQFAWEDAVPAAESDLRFNAVVVSIA